MNVYESYRAPNEGGLFLRLEDGKEFKLRLQTEPYIFNSEFTDKNTGETKISTKYAWAAWNYSDDRPNIVQLPVSGFRQVQALAQDTDWGDPTSYDLKMTRTGSGLETKYHVIPNPDKSALSTERQLAVAEIDVADKVKGIPLSQVVEGKEVPTAKPSEPDLPPTEAYDAPPPF